MASVKKRNDSPFWVCCYRLKDGTRKQVSSGLSDRNAAMQMALRLEALACDWSKSKALDLIEEIARAQGIEAFDPTPLCQYLPAWRLARESGWRPSTVKSFRAIEKRFLSECGTLQLGRVETSHLADYRDGLYRLGRSRRTVSCHIKYLRRVFETAIESGKLDHNPAAIKLLPPKPSIKQPFSMQQFKALLNATDGEWHTLILVAGLTGQRLGDCLRLTHEEIDREGSRIRFKRAKNRDYHCVPLHPAIRSAIAPGFGPLLPELGTLPMTGSRSVSARFREDILPRIGIIQEYATDTDGNKQVTEYSFHSLRHMLSTELNRIGASPETRMSIVGHNDKRVSAGYTHVDFAAAQAALARISV